jgi:hypothetical protein
MSSIYDQGDNAFRSALNDYSSQYGSIAQSRLGTDIDLTTAKEQLYSAGAQIKESAGLQSVSDRIQAEGEKYMNEMGIDMSASGVLTGTGLLMKGAGETMQFFSSKSGLGLNNANTATWSRGARNAPARYRALNVDREEPFRAPLRERMTSAQDISDARRQRQAAESDAEPASEARQAELAADRGVTRQTRGTGDLGDINEEGFGEGGGVSRATNLDDLITRRPGGRVGPQKRTTTDLDDLDEPDLADINNPIGDFAESGGAPSLTDPELVTDINNENFGSYFGRGVARSTQLDPADVQMRPSRTAPIDDNELPTGLTRRRIEDIPEGEPLDGERGLGKVSDKLREENDPFRDLDSDARPRAMTLDDLRLPDRPSGVTAGEGTLRTTRTLQTSTDDTGGKFMRVRSATIGREAPRVPRSVQRMGQGDDTLPTADEQQTGDLPTAAAEPPSAPSALTMRNPKPPPQRPSTPEPETKETDTSDYFRGQGERDTTGQFGGRNAPPEGTPDGGAGRPGGGDGAPGGDGAAAAADTQATTEARNVAAQGQADVASAESNITSEISQESQAASRTAATVAEDIAPEITQATETAAASGWATAGSVALTGGGALLKLAGIAAMPLAAFGLYESIKGVQDAISDEDVDPYKKIRGQVADANAHLNQMGQTISADQFASTIAGATPRFGSLRPPFSTRRPFPSYLLEQDISKS